MKKITIDFAHFFSIKISVIRLNNDQKHLIIVVREGTPSLILSCTKNPLSERANRRESERESSQDFFLQSKSEIYDDETYFSAKSCIIFPKFMRKSAKLAVRMS